MQAAQTALDYLTQYLYEQRLAELPDAQLVEHFVVHSDDASFAVLVRRHGPMVLGLCRRLLGQHQDAEDAFQAAFLVLARRAGSLRKRQSLAAWLHGVAYRIAHKARTTAARRRQHEQQAGLSRLAQQTDDSVQPDSSGLFDEELARLPERLREPLILCYLDGLTREEAAQRLSLAPRTLKARLARGRALLRKALERRGVAESRMMGLFAPLGVPVVLTGSTVRHAAIFSTRLAGAQEIPASVLALAKHGLGTVLLPRVSVVLLVILALGGLILGLGLASPLPPVEVRKAAPPTHPAGESRPAVDRHGDPLPEGALARLGTVRLRQGEPIDHLGLSRDGKLLATGGTQGPVRLWDTRTGKSIREFTTESTFWAVALSGDGRQLACSKAWAIVQVFDVRTGKQTARLTTTAGCKTGTVCLSLAFSPDGTLLAGGSQDTIHVWRLKDERQLHTFPAGATVCRSVSFSADGKLLATGGDGKSPQLWDLETGKLRIAINDRKSLVHCTALSPDGKRLAVGYEDGFLYLWNTVTGKAEHILRAHRTHSSVTALAFTADGKTLFSTGRGDRHVRQWEVMTAKESGTLPIETYDGMNVAVSADGKTLTAGGTNCTVRIWHSKRNDRNDPVWQELVLSDAHQSQVHTVAFSPDGKTLASAAWNGPSQLWDVASARLIATSGVNAESVFTLAFHPDGRSLVLSGRDHKVHWCNSRTAAVSRTQLWKQESYPVAIGFGDGKTLVAGYGQQLVHLAEMQQAAKVIPLAGDLHSISQIAFAPDGRMLAASSSSRKEILLWDTVTGRQTRKIDGVRAAWTLSLSADGRFLAAGEDSLVRIWDLDSGKEVVQIRDHPHRIVSLAFSRDGRWLASSCADLAVRLWETASWKQAGLFRGHMGVVKGLAFSSDGQILATGSSDTSVLLWDLSDRFAKDRRPPLTRPKLEILWAELAEDAEKARRAIWALARSPKESGPFLRERLCERKVDPKRIDQLIVELDDDSFEVRVRATKELETLGDVAGPAMRQALEKTKSLEVRDRLRRCLTLLDPAKTEQHRLRRLRALAALEYAGITPARHVPGSLQRE
jgi:RNA polymerase sigma factor (sigma-70 family)